VPKHHVSCVEMDYLTDANIAMGVSGTLALAGIVHALPGPTLKMQSEQMGMPQWFIACAGLLMIGSGAFYHVRPQEGIFAVSLCMGGAFATAANMPIAAHRPGGMCFSSMFLLSTFWVARASISLTMIVVVSVAFGAGVAGRVYVPGHPQIAKLFGTTAASQKSNGSSKKDAAPEVKKMPEKAQEAKKKKAALGRSSRNGSCLLRLFQDPLLQRKI